MGETKTSSGGLGLGTVLFLIFLVLKLTDKIDWSWWWITSPLWIPLSLGILIGGFIVFLKAIVDRH
tara:strand:+ start:1723 stop:1920 length:198 start_codon:yes stop_codon:yes gene_type:complete